jgi:hypothetical protein
MRIAAVVLALLLTAAAACSKINAENFGKVRDGMSEHGSARAARHAD